jgi:hypothetical protein
MQLLNRMLLLLPRLHALLRAQEQYEGKETQHEVDGDGKGTWVRH